jgi:aminomethyltransferase
MVEFGGWEMPVQYAGILEEHHAVRTAAGLFDISHMGEFEVSGPDALAFLQYALTQNIAAIPPGQSNYALICRPDGTVVDDTFVYHLPEGGPFPYLVVVNAANIEKDFAWLLDRVAERNFDVTLTNASERYAMLALQGPRAEVILTGITGPDVAELAFHAVASATLLGAIPALVARTGYTGEDGFELFVAPEHAVQIWDALLAQGAAHGLKLCGLGARDSLRFEACLALYGHELNDTTNPYEARLGWVVKLDKGEFVGRAALAEIKQAGPQRRLVGIELVERGVARADYPIQMPDGATIGIVTSGMPAPTLGKSYALGYVPAEFSSEGADLQIVMRGRPIRARVVRMPFYKPRYKK